MTTLLLMLLTGCAPVEWTLDADVACVDYNCASLSWVARATGYTGAVEYEWSFEDGSTDGGRSVSREVVDGQRLYQGRLTATADDGSVRYAAADIAVHYDEPDDDATNIINDGNVTVVGVSGEDCHFTVSATMGNPVGSGLGGCISGTQYLTLEWVLDGDAPLPCDPASTDEGRCVIFEKDAGVILPVQGSTTAFFVDPWEYGYDSGSNIADFHAPFSLQGGDSGRIELDKFDLNTQSLGDQTGYFPIVVGCAKRETPAIRWVL